MPVVVCFGDSNTFGFDAATMRRLPKRVRWPGVAAAALGSTVEVIEEGLNGRTTIWDDPFLDGRNGRAYLLPCLRSHAPVDVVVIMLGTNDTKTIFGRSAAEIASGAQSLVDAALRSATGPDGGAPRVLLVCPPVPGEVTEHSEVWGFGEARAKGERMRALYRTVADMTGAAFLDAAALMAVDPVDGVHLAPGDHATLGRAIAEAVRGLL
jgi:lysophospholipase L1-like esterase